MTSQIRALVYRGTLLTGELNCLASSVESCKQALISAALLDEENRQPLEKGESLWIASDSSGNIARVILHGRGREASVSFIPKSKEAA